MNQLLEKIKNWFLGVFDSAADFCREKWEDQRLLCVAVLAVFLLIILLLILIPSLNGSKTGTSGKNADTQIQEIELEPFLSIPTEPSIENDYVYSRKNVTRWSEESVGQWFSEPDDEMLEELRKANEKLVDDMMEVVP